MLGLARECDDDPTKLVVLIDMNLDYDEGGGTIYGTDICRELRAHGFLGMVVIVSANDEPEARAEYLDAGADGCFGKGVGGGVAKMVDYLAATHQSLASQPRDYGKAWKG